MNCFTISKKFGCRNVLFCLVITLLLPLLPKNALSQEDNTLTKATNGSSVANQDFYYETGEASWYGKRFHGKRTSSGQRFNMNHLTAAHRTLPIPSNVKVTNLQNGKSITVRVNDRGPYRKGRVIDLSYAAAKKLGFAKKGYTQVSVELVHSI